MRREGPEDVDTIAAPDRQEIGLSDIGASGAGASEIGLSEIGFSEIGVSDIGVSDFVVSDIGASDIGVSDIDGGCMKGTQGKTVALGGGRGSRVDRDHGFATRRGDATSGRCPSSGSPLPIPVLSFENAEATSRPLCRRGGHLGTDVRGHQQPRRSSTSSAIATSHQREQWADPRSCLQHTVASLSPKGDPADGVRERAPEVP